MRHQAKLCFFCFLIGCAGSCSGPTQRAQPLQSIQGADVVFSIAAPPQTRIALRVFLNDRFACDIEGEVPAASTRGPIKAARYEDEGLVVIQRVCALRVAEFGSDGFNTPMRVEGFLSNPEDPQQRVPVSYQAPVGAGCELLMEPDCVGPTLILKATGAVEQNCHCCCCCDWDKA